MQVILKPVTHQELGEIIIKDDLFAIGRHEKPFSDFNPRFVEKLSRRHARIFEQDGAVYIADLGSLNGTTVNGENVDSLPVKLQRGDEICFTGHLCYQIEILGAVANRAVEAGAAPPVKVILTPEKQREILEPIVVTQFPFLINKTSDVFSRYSETLPKEVSYISRRHAHIFLRGRAVYIEDLGSTNGTFVSGSRLEEHARKLEDGDVVAFGGENFIYRVGLYYANEEASRKPPDGSELPTATGHGAEDVTRTTFVTSANSFLDIFCAEDENRPAGEQEAQQAGGLGSQSQVATGHDRASGTPGSLNWPRMMLHELKGAFFDQGEKRSKKVWLLLVVIVGIAGFGIYYGTASERAVKELMERGEYAEAAVEANHYLASHAEDQEIVDLATEAVMKATLPVWLKSMAKQAFQDAEQEIVRGKRMSEANPEAQQTFDTLSWLTRLEQFMGERGGPDKPLILFVEENPINELLDWWERDPKSHRRRLGAVAQYVPEFAEFRATAFSHLRTLQNQQSLSIAAIERLLKQLESDLDKGDTETLQDTLVDFEHKYPRISGVQKLRNDLDRYQQFNEELQAHNWIRAQNLASTTVYETPFFQSRVQTIAAKELPPPAVIERYADAQLDWINGEIDAAMNALEVLSQERWGEVAVRRLQHNRVLVSDFEALKKAKGGADYDRRLLAFYRRLDPVQDAYFVSSVADEFQVHRKKAVGEAVQLVAAATTAWRHYRESGGIQGLHRLEAGVSDAFRQRAARLSEAFTAMERALEIYRLLKVSYPAELDRQFAQIENEVRLQRQSLAELEMVLEPSLRKSKLALLPRLGATRNENKK